VVPVSLRRGLPPAARTSAVAAISLVRVSPSMVFAPFPSIFPSPKTPLISRTDGLVRGKNENTGRSDCQDILAWRAKNGFAMRGFGSWRNEAVASDPRLSDSVVSLAGVSHSEFAEMFASEEECVSATLEEGIARLTRTVGEATQQSARDLAASQPAGDDAREESQERWLARVRAGLVGLLGFLDDESRWSRLLFLDDPATGLDGIESERRVLGVLSELVGEGPGEGVAGERSSRSPSVIDELVMSGVMSVIRPRVLHPDGGHLVTLAPSLTAFIAAPYLDQASLGAELVRRAPNAGDGRQQACVGAGAVGPNAGSDRASAEDRSVQRGALSQTSGVGGSPGGGLARRSIVNREDKGVVDK
jgi:hypothetical protein